MAFNASTPRLLERIADALEHLLQRGNQADDVASALKGADVFDWDADTGALTTLAAPNAHPLEVLRGMGQQKRTLGENTRRFAAGLPANNALLWGARGTGKSALVKAVYAALPAPRPAIIEIAREDLASLPTLLKALNSQPRRVIIFCDDLSFDAGETQYKSLKAALEGGLSSRQNHVLIYATSNRRHLMPRTMIDNERATAIHPAEATEEAVSLSDRFGLWLGFHAMDQTTYLEIIHTYAARYSLPVDEIDTAAKQWATTRGARSGRVAWQFIMDWAGQHGLQLDEAA